jgi:hypothetical protein
LLLDNETDVPLAGAGPVRVAVPVEVPPNGTEVGFNVIDASCGACTASVALRVTPLYVAEMLAVVFVDTGIVVIVKFAFCAPAGTTTLDGTFTPDRFEAVAIVILVAATPVRVTVPVDELPPCTLAGFNARALKAGGFTVRVAEALVTPR